jgi:hypothetical protein
VAAHIVMADYLGKHPKNSDLPGGSATGPSRLPRPPNHDKSDREDLIEEYEATYLSVAAWNSDPRFSGGRQNAARARLRGGQILAFCLLSARPLNDEILCC